MLKYLKQYKNKENNKSYVTFPSNKQHDINSYNQKYGIYKNKIVQWGRKIVWLDVIQVYKILLESNINDKKILWW